jgi:PleD family two-component response regulator
MTLDTARLVAERLCRAVAETQLPCKNGPVALTISIGVAFYDGVAREAINELFERGQKACAQAVSAGGNRVKG